MPRRPQRRVAPATVRRQRFAVAFDYPVYFTRGVFDPVNPVLVRAIDRLRERRRHRVLVYLDAGLVAATPGLARRVASYFQRHADRLELAAPPAVVPGGEQAKNGWSQVRAVMSAIGDRRLCRQSVVVAAGGGSVLDMVGFATALVHRGLRLVRLPSTVLAQNDAGVGVKNGMNERETKNYIGAFAPPFAVVNDFEFLRTLADRDWVGGVAEAFKVALIKDARFFEFLCRRAEALRARDFAAMARTVRRCAELHLEHIRTSGDPFEFGSARPLDFGHWAAHKLEVLSGYALGHGQAVAIGMALDSYAAWRRRLLSRGDLERFVAALQAAGLPVWSPLLERRDARGRLEVLNGLEDFREHLGGRLTIVLPHGIGARREVHAVDAAVVKEAMAFLRERGGGTL
jgi:3-dehydroquinate synthase